ncbi:lipocalin family protein [Flavobacterium sp. PLA-1-15]|uniref:lipocalin family protein n=1 Tax=Flavobacterium sp. PLA-1-15 TaxID=3380533 RepID=UPI003B815482
MKKIILLIAIATFSLGCSSDDSDKSVNIEQQIAGKWRNVSQKNNNTPVTLSECELKNTYSFSNPLKQFFAEVNSTNAQNECEENILLGTYNLSGNSCSITVNNETVILNDISFSGEVMTTNEMDGPIKVTRTWIKTN